MFCLYVLNRLQNKKENLVLYAHNRKGEKKNIILQLNKKVQTLDKLL